MSDISSLQGTTWYWRQGLRDTPMHSDRDSGDFCKTKELYLPVEGENRAQIIMDELKSHNIKMAKKRTHSHCDVVPAGSLIVFAAKSLSVEDTEEKNNIENLKKYILAHGGKIFENEQKKSMLGSIMTILFGGGRK